ncbi:hypothetical protein BDV06DRAFT_231633 [Aspergillus oleicola]
MISCTYPGCTAQYRRKEHLTRHAKKHYTSTPRLTCEVCHKKFDRTDSLRRHRQLHTRHGEDVAPRTSKACDQCHRSKTRCDGGQPCGVCARRGGACTFDRLSKRNRENPGSMPLSQRNTRTEDIQNALELHRTNAEAGIPSDTDSLSDMDGSGYGRHDPNYQRTEMEDLMLQHETQLREKGLLASRCRASGGEKAVGNGDLDIDHYVHVYFSHFHYQWPMLHCRSFRLSKEPQILLLAVVMIGLWVTGENTAQARAETMHEKLVSLLENQMDTWQKITPFKNKVWPFTTYQTVILNIIFAMARHNTPPNLYSRCRTLLLTVTETCITGGLFKYPAMRSQIEPTDSVLFTWTYMEEIKRLALTIFKLNLHFNTGLLTLSDLEFPPPDNGYLWDAPDSREFYRRYNSQLESGTAVDGGVFICEIVRGVKEGNNGENASGSGLGVLLSADPWVGLVMVMEPSRALERALSHLTKDSNLFNHGQCHHQSHHHNAQWFLEMDTWVQLELLRHLLCQRDPSKGLNEETLKDIDTVILYRKSHSLLIPSSSIPPRLTIGKTKISLWKGDITTLANVTVIVNAANYTLLGCFQPAHRCIDNVIHSAAGPRLRLACYEIMQAQGEEEPVGSAKVTKGFNLEAKYVIHTVGPQIRPGQEPHLGHRGQLAQCYVSCLDAAENLPPLADGRNVIVFCCVSTGLFAFPSDVAADIALKTVTQWCAEHPKTSITDIIFDTFMQRDWELYNRRIAPLCWLDPNADRKLNPSIPSVSPAVEIARSWLHQADYLIISAGAGLSAATGLDYTSRALFATHFPAFTRLGLNCLYDVFGFQGWKSPGQRWGYYFTHLNTVRNWPESPLYASLLNIAEKFGKRYFVRTSNADGFFVKNHFNPARISTPQASYGYIQCLSNCRREAVFASAPFRDAALPDLDPVSQELINESKVPICKYCGGDITICVRGGDYFNDVPFRGQEGEYARFIEHISTAIEQDAKKKGIVKPKCVILELGVGMNTPSVLRWPNEELVEEGSGGFRLIRAGIDVAGCAPWALEENGLAVGINGDLNTIVDLLGC